MKYYSDFTKKLYDSETALEEAEIEYFDEQEEKEAKLAEKKKDADEVAEAYKAIRDAQEKYFELKDAFIKKYGYFHMTFKEIGEKPVQDVFDAFRGFLNWPFQ